MSQPTCFSLIFSPGARAVSRDLPALEVLPPGPCCNRPVTGAGDLDLSDIVSLYPLITHIRLRYGRSFLNRCSFRPLENLVNSAVPNFGEVAQARRRRRDCLHVARQRSICIRVSRPHGAFTRLLCRALCRALFISGGRIRVHLTLVFERSMRTFRLEVGLYLLSIWLLF